MRMHTFQFLHLQNFLPGLASLWEVRYKILSPQSQKPRRRTAVAVDRPSDGDEELQDVVLAMKPDEIDEYDVKMKMMQG